MSRARDEQLDVCFLLEGTYPFIRGGVSSWVHQLIAGMPELRFGIVFLGSASGDYGEPAYPLPENVVHLESHFLSDANVSHSSNGWKPIELGELSELHSFCRGAAEGLTPGVRKILRNVGTSTGIDRSMFDRSPDSWQFIREQNGLHHPAASFIDYFWTVRAMHTQVFWLAEIAERAPQARIYHAASTGYAGLLGSLIAERTGRPLVLSEHGIYTKERKIDLNSATWIPEPRFPGDSGVRGDSIRKLWIDFFQGLGRITYSYADPVISLFGGSSRRQVEDGAEASRTLVIPNGIEVERFAQAYAARPRETPKVVGFIGRVVPIKDVKTFIRAMRLVCDSDPGVEGWIIGSGEETPEYHGECETLVANLGLTENVKFLGHRNVLDLLPKLGLLMLTSLSEGQPLTILEAFAAGVPVVATDVGSCRELVEGAEQADAAHGVAGRVVPIAAPEASAAAVLELLSNDERWRQAQASAIERVRALYTQKRMLEHYSSVYGKAA